MTWGRQEAGAFRDAISISLDLVKNTYTVTLSVLVRTSSSATVGAFIYDR